VTKLGSQPDASLYLRTGGRSEQEAQDLRATIIEAAALAFSQRGFAATKIDDVAEIMGATKGLIYYHFKSKSDLFLAVHHDALADDLAEIAAIAARDQAADRKLFDMLYAHTMFVIERNPTHRVVVQGIELHIAGATTPPQRRMVETIIALRDRYQALFLQVIEDGIADGTFRAEDPRLAVKAVLGAVNWMCMWFKPDPSQTAEMQRDLARKMVSVAIGGIHRVG